MTEHDDQCRCDGCVNTNFPRPQAVIDAELRQLAEKHSSPDQLAWMRAQYPHVFGVVAATDRNLMKKTKDSEVKIEKFTRNLRVTLKEGEVVERAKRSAFLLGEIQQKESERDAAKKQANAQIEELGAEMHRLSLEVRDGAAYRDVPCTRHYVYRVGIVEERRSDTNELLTDRPMTERERQLELEGLAGKKDASSEAKTLSDDVVKAEAVKKLVEAGAQVLPTEKKPRKPRKPKAQADASAQA